MIWHNTSNAWHRLSCSVSWFSNHSKPRFIFSEHENRSRKQEYEEHLFNREMSNKLSQKAARIHRYVVIAHQWRQFSMFLMLANPIGTSTFWNNISLVSTLTMNYSVILVWLKPLNEANARATASLYPEINQSSVELPEVFFVSRLNTQLTFSYNRSHFVDISSDTDIITKFSCNVVCIDFYFRLAIIYSLHCKQREAFGKPKGKLKEKLSREQNEELNMANESWNIGEYCW